MRFHSYLLFDTRPSIHELSEKKLSDAKREFSEVITAHQKVKVRAYSTLALRAGTRFMLHVNASTPDDIQLLARDLLRTEFGTHLVITYTLLGITRSSQYNPKNPPKESAPDEPHRYLVVYPFTKTIEWHLVPFDDRRSMMKDHVDVGRKYASTISQLLLYSFGIDDHEFIVSYQMDDLEEFQTLVMELRGTEARRHTKSDLPIFTGIHNSIEEALEMI